MRIITPPASSTGPARQLIAQPLQTEKSSSSPSSVTRDPTDNSFETRFFFRATDGFICRNACRQCPSERKPVAGPLSDSSDRSAPVQPPRRSWRDLLGALRDSMHIVSQATRRLNPSASTGATRPADAGLTYILETRRRFHGRTLRLRLRANTADETWMHEVLQERSPLALPPDARPRVIVDVGSGVGGAALCFALMFPGAVVHCFEPDPAKLALLRHNVNRHCLNVRVHERGLGHCSLPRHPDGYDRPVVTLSQAMTDLGIQSIDVLHLAAGPWTGAVLRGTPASVRSSAAAIILSGGVGPAAISRGELVHLLGNTHTLETHGPTVHAVLQPRDTQSRAA
jgi:hypothetical protein